MTLKRVYIYIIFCLYFCTANGQTRRALFVAIDKYPRNSGWSEIHATNDVSLMLPMLEKKNFNVKNIKILLNKEATKLKIVEQLKLLADNSHEGDNIYIHFSCHGQQVVDDNGDEQDGFDEALVPYDAKSRFSQEAYQGENYIRDDLMETLLDNIRESVGESGYVTLVIDACHSGTINSGIGFFSGASAIIGTPIIATEDCTQIFELDDKVSFKLERRSGFSHITVFSACLPHQISYEYFDTTSKTYYGALSYALFQVFSKNDVYYSVNQLHNALSKEIAKMFKTRKKRQIVYIESTNEDQISLIGGGK